MGEVVRHYGLFQTLLISIAGRLFIISLVYFNYMKKIKLQHGFTVLELLVILGIITILIGLVLTGLNAARKHSNDERKVATLKTVALGLREYFNICRAYPVDLQPTETCPALSSQTPARQLSDVISGIGDLHVNDTGSKYHYVSLVDTVSNNAGISDCTNFHLWVDLDVDGASLLSQKSNKTGSDYAQQGLESCTGNTVTPIGTQSNTIYDIFK